MSDDDFTAPQATPEPTPPGNSAHAPETVTSPADDAYGLASPSDSIKILVTCVLAWAVPGLGHIASGRVGRGLVFAIVVLGLFVGGIGLHGKVYRPEQGEPLTYLAAVGAAGVGLPYVAAHAMGMGFGDIRTQSYEYGNTFTLVAGLLNLLIVLDAYDVASGRR
jgi:hypothetical protein